MNLILKKILKNEVLKNFSVLTFSSILAQGLAIISSIKIAKSLMPEFYGLFSFVLSLSSIYVVIVSLGLRNVMIRSIAINRETAFKQFTISFIIRTLAFIVGILLIFYYNYYFSKVTLDNHTLLLLCINVFALLQWDTIESITFGFEKMKFSAYVNVLMTVIWVLIIFLLPEKIITVKLLLLITVIIQILKVLILTFFAYKEKMIRFSNFKNKSEIKSISKDAFPFYILAIFTLFTSQLSVVYLEQMSNYQEIAYFNISNRIIYPLELVLLTLMTSLFPVLSRNHEHDKERFSKTINITFLSLFSIGVLGALVISTFRNEIVELLYGSSYSATADVIAIQCWYVILFGIFCFIGTVLSATNRQVLLSKLSILYAIISAPCLIYGARFGANGLAIGFIVAGILNMTYHLYWIQKSIPKKINVKYFYAALGIYVFFFLASLIITKLDFITRIAVMSVFLSTIGIIGYKAYQINKKKKYSL